MYTVAAFYLFLALPDPAALREELCANFTSADLLGTTLIAPEGINGTVAGEAAAIDCFLDFLAGRTGLDRAEVKFSTTEAEPFRRLKFKLKREIITFRNAPSTPRDPANMSSPKSGIACWPIPKSSCSIPATRTRPRSEPSPAR